MMHLPDDPFALGVGLGLVGVGLAMLAGLLLIAIINRRPWTLKRRPRRR